MSTSKETNSFDVVYQKIGECGSYQIFLFVAIGFVSIVTSVVDFGYNFYGAVPDHRCKIPALPNDSFEILNSSHQALIDKFVPINTDVKIKGPYDNCHLRKFHNTTGNFSTSLVPCREYVYSKQYYQNTLITEWNLVCDQYPRAKAIMTLFFMGSFGNLLSGLLSDKFGRKRILYILVVSNTLIHLLILLFVNRSFSIVSLGAKQIIYMILRFMSGITCNTYTVSIVMAIEFCGTNKRVLAVNICYYMYIFGEFLVVLLAYFIRDFDIFLIVQTVLLSVFVTYFWLIPESPLWLLSKNKFDQAAKILHEIAQSNKKELDEVALKEQADVVKNKNESNKTENENLWSGLKKLSKSYKISVLLVVILFNWLVNKLIYYGISFNTGNMFGDPYLNYTLSVVCELLGIVACDMTLERWGRKLPFCVCILLTGLSFLSIQFVPVSKPGLITTLTLIGKFLITISHNTLYIVTAELAPTIIRNSLSSFLQTIGSLGVIASPYIQLLGETYWFPFPFIVYGSLSVLAALVFILIVPETKGRKMNDTVDEMIADAATSKSIRI